LKYGALPANLAGKAKTMVQTIAITFCLLPFELWWEPARWIGLALVLLAVVLTVWSGLVNLKDGLRLRREALSGQGRCRQGRGERGTSPGHRPGPGAWLDAGHGRVADRRRRGGPAGRRPGGLRGGRRGSGLLLPRRQDPCAGGRRRAARTPRSGDRRGRRGDGRRRSGRTRRPGRDRLVGSGPPWRTDHHPPAAAGGRARTGASPGGGRRPGRARSGPELSRSLLDIVSFTFPAIVRAGPLDSGDHFRSDGRCDHRDDFHEEPLRRLRRQRPEEGRQGHGAVPPGA